MRWRIEEVPRKHYLYCVVNAFPDHAPDGEILWESEGPSQRTVGVSFRDTAENAAEEGTRTREVWYEISERLATQRRAKEALESVNECIDRYFELELCDWQIIDVERDFEFDVGSDTVVGLMGAVYRTPSDELVVIDYKATQRERDIDENRQLPLYLFACRDLYDEPIHHAGYAYVGPPGPKIESKEVSQDDLDDVEQEIQELPTNISGLNYSRYIEDSHCQRCHHNGLPCAETRRTGGSPGQGD